ncbi:unnamed protein product [Mytilus coruscus]|uniref:Uncharacterized protein n=1 Tax=Mytilus coruscus TaxID=42192 RepID=A0A6J8C3F8_MYTCO|nr:unnamed protein product [Mytilus coruscus]
MQITEMEDEDSEPENIETTLVNDDFEQRNRYFTDVCSTVVQRLRHTLNTNALTVDDGTGPPVFCCGEDLDDDTIACSAGTNCTHGEVFHYMCADIDPNNLPNKLARQLLASVHSWLPEKLRVDIIHNRTVNYGGGIGRNLPMDFMNEILNRLFKELLSCAKGQYTNATIQRCSQIIGPFGEALDTVFDSQVVENELYRHRRRSGNRDGNVKQLISFLQNDKLFAFTVGRNHKAFPDFQFSENPRNPGQFQPKMIQLSKKLDKRRRVILNDD